MTLTARFLWLCCMCAIYSTAYSAGYGSGGKGVALDTLASNSEWHALLHFEPPYAYGDPRSAINTSAFFLAPDGAINPVSELVATLDAFHAPVDNGDDHARCRFPARFLWLARHISSLKNLQIIDCESYQQWLGEKPVSSISMVFAAGHMKSPASYFGHNFLKFNTDASHDGSRLLDETINYGADVPDNEGGLTYFYQGIFGGYSAVYERQAFFRHMAKYGEEDLRDVWEYELNFNSREIALLVAHTWELQQVELTYYFFRENCAYQIARLLALVTPARLVPQYMPWTMPYNVFAALMEVEIRGEPLVRDIYYHPSRRSRFHQRYFELTVDERKIFTRQVSDDLNVDQLKLLPAASQLKLIDAMIDYFEFRLRLDSEDKLAGKAKDAVLLYRFSLPPETTVKKTFEKPFAPHLAQRPGYVGVSAVHNQSFGSGVELRFRPAYFDFLSLDIGRSASGEFTVLDTAVVFNDQDYAVRRFDLLNVTNLAPSVTGISGDSGASWRFRAGVSSTNNGCMNCQRAMLEWQRGKAIKLSPRLTGFLLAGGKVQKPAGRDNPVALKLRAGVAGAVVPGLRIHAMVERHEDTGRNGLDRNRVLFDFRFAERSHWDVRFSYKRDVAEEFSLTAGYYW